MAIIPVQVGETIHDIDTDAISDINYGIIFTAGLLQWMNEKDITVDNIYSKDDLHKIDLRERNLPRT